MMVLSQDRDGESNLRNDTIFHFPTSLHWSIVHVKETDFEIF
jgi:hypothetical protein